MSDSITLRIQQAKDFIRTQAGGTIAPLPISEEEINPNLQDDLSYRARPLESTTQAYPVNFNFPDDSLCTEFSFFEDGRQKTINIGYIATVVNQRVVIIPVHFFAVGAVILERDPERKLMLWGQPEIRTGIIVERSLVPDQSVLENFERDGLEVVDVTTTTGNDYSNLRMKALQKAKDMRLEIETTLITRWRESNAHTNKFLVIDGTLMNYRNEENIEWCIGVSKSFGSRYFDSSDHNRILQMNEFERSWTFRFHDDDDNLRLGVRERLSWYLRLRNRVNADPEFGLIRVEISQRHLNYAAQFAERFSRSLLSERLPTAYPTPRWDKHLYPIQMCEDYLSSILPSTKTIISTMKG